MARQTSLIRKRIEKAYYSPADFLVVEDEQRPTTWRIRVSQNGVPSERLMRQAYAYLTKGFAGRTYKGPQKEQAMSKLRSMFRAMNKPVPGKASESAARPTRSAESVTPEIADTDKTLDEFNEGVGYVYLDGEVPGVPYGVTSFGDLYAADEAKEHANEVMVLAYQFTRMVENVISSVDIPDRLAAIQNLVNEFMGLAADAMAPEQPADGQVGGQEQSAGEAGAETPEGEKFAESLGGLLDLAESLDAPTSGVPLTMRVGIIKPGFGNERDNHYYPAEVLRRDAGVFVGAKMYETDHKESERSTRTWVSTIDSIEGFGEDGSPIARVIVHDPNFAERLRALSAAGKLSAMECSILATGRAKTGQVEGKQANVVEAITAAHAVDWVTRAGAGGRALDLSESADGAAAPETEEQKPAGFTAPTQPAEPAPATFEDAPADTTDSVVVDGATAAGDAGQEKPAPTEKPATDAPVADPETPATTTTDGAPEQLADASKPVEATETAATTPVLLSEAQVLGELERTRLPAASRERLARARYTTAAELGAAIDAEIAYVKELTGSGLPVMQTQRVETHVVVTAETAQKNVKAINTRYFGR